MSKPDWAARLQRTFRRKYEQGVIDENTRIAELLKSEFLPYEIVRISVRDLLKLIELEDKK